ncbi:hypothetical protein [Rheinheimera salexigens]|uniref:Uncharacterized protein n=1 Tax=Rheinheimera salexigens TaxID=1628148 RepID=A0A1E7Q3R5_9GAMM|nr:hypothetical protein [Rheinheimera salexigens]OEY68766.1 hypothetical protein BI198_03680 [Rheinheimera salexigens]
MANSTIGYIGALLVTLPSEFTHLFQQLIIAPSNHNSFQSEAAIDFILGKLMPTQSALTVNQ